MADVTVRRCRPLLGTFVEITVPEAHMGAIDTAFAAIAYVHARMSFHEEGSDLAALRRARRGESVRVDRRTVEVLRIAQDLHRRSNGLFDVTIGANLVTSGFLPPPLGVDMAAAIGTMADVVTVDDEHIRCLAPTLIDLGGIAKGFAVDLAIAALADAGVPSAVVNAGGDLRVLGSGHVVHLREADGRLGQALEIANCAVASSSNAMTRRVIDGAVATPHLGAGRRPLLANEAFTVLADECVIADAMTKIAMADLALASAMLGELGGVLLGTAQRGIAA